MAEVGHDRARELVLRAHEADPDPVEFDTEAGLADLFARAARLQAGRSGGQAQTSRPAASDQETGTATTD